MRTGQAELISRQLGAQAPLLLQPRVERRVGQCAEHADHGVRNGGVLDEVDHLIEAVRTVVVESQDESRPDIQAPVQQPMHLRHQVAPEVLDLARLFQGFRRGGLDSHEHCREAGPGHEVHELRVVGNVHRGLGVELQRRAHPLPPGGDGREQLLHRALVPDEVVVHEEDISGEAGAANGLQLGDDLGRGLGNLNTWLD